MRARPRVAAPTLALLATLLGAGASAAQLPAIAREAPLDPRQTVNFHALVRPDTVYVGQQANYQVGVFLGDEVRARLRRNPEFVPPEMTGMLAYELPVSHGAVPAAGGGRYEVHVFERAVFPLMAGRHEVPPARLSYSLPLSRSFFSREESYTIRSRGVHVVAIAPPDSGRPAGYDGAVATGLDVRAVVREDSTARVGDPLLLTVRVSGRGNVNLFPRPRLQLAWAQAVPSDERVTLDSTSRLVAGSKEFDWLVTPRRQGRVVVPAVRYPYFDPYTERYVLAVAPPETLAVGAGTLAALDSAPTAAGAAPLDVRRTWGGEAPRPPGRAPLYWAAVAVGPLPVLLLAFRRRGPRRRPEPDAPTRLRAIGAEPGRVPPRRVRGALLDALAHRVGLPASAVTRGGVLSRALRREGVSVAVAAEAERLLAELDAACYAGTGTADAALARRAADVFAQVDAEARRPPRAGARRAVSPLVALLAAAAAVGGAGVAGAVQADMRPAAATLFADGVRSYEARRYTDASALFAAATRRAARAPDAWANLGTAAWMAGDSATAAVGWQRALRLQPTADDVRVRLQMLPVGQLAGAAAVPPVSAWLVEWAALGLWLLAWALAARVFWRRRGRRFAPAATAGVAAVALGAAAVLLDERLAAHDLAVVGAATPLRASPAIAAGAAAAVPAGTVVHLGVRNGVWTRVTAGEASGWLPSAELRPLRRE